MSESNFDFIKALDDAPEIFFYNCTQHFDDEPPFMNTVLDNLKSKSFCMIPCISVEAKNCCYQCACLGVHKPMSMIEALMLPVIENIRMTWFSCDMTNIEVARHALNTKINGDEDIKCFLAFSSGKPAFPTIHSTFDLLSKKELKGVSGGGLALHRWNQKKPVSKTYCIAITQNKDTKSEFESFSLSIEGLDRLSKDDIKTKLEMFKQSIKWRKQSIVIVMTSGVVSYTNILNDCFSNIYTLYIEGSKGIFFGNRQDGEERKQRTTHSVQVVVLTWGAPNYPNKSAMVKCSHIK